MSNSEPSFGSTFASGIQDISAFLPILGTDQCESHVGNALDKGYIYAAASPLSMFGCLGIVKASLAIFVASLSPYWARLLRDAGLTLKGSAANMIGLAEGNEEKYQMEAPFSALYTSWHLYLPGKVVSLNFTFRYLRWDRRLFASTCVLAIFSISPYVPIIISDQKTSPITVFLYPLLRIIGSCICVIAAQVIIQLRIEMISYSLFNKVTSTRTQKVRVSRHNSLSLVICQAAIILGAIATVVGYLGCFTLVQKTKPLNAYLWLGLEATLSIFRVYMWACNPNWDEDTGISIRTMSSLPKTTLLLSLKPRRRFLEQISQRIGPQWENLDLEWVRFPELEFYTIYHALVRSEQGYPNTALYTVAQKIDDEESEAYVLENPLPNEPWKVYRAHLTYKKGAVILDLTKMKGGMVFAHQF